MSKKLLLSINPEGFYELVEKLNLLTDIEDVIKIKINKDFTLMYSIMGNDGQVSAMKCFLIETKKIIEKFNEEDSYDFVLTSATKFVKNIKFLNPSKPIKLELIAKPIPEEDGILQIRTINLTNDKLKISSIGAELHKIKDLKKSFIETRLDLKKSKWSFKVTNEDFMNIKKLSNINSEDRILNINVTDNKIYFSELSKWELQVDEFKVNNQNIMMNKKYLSFIDTDDDNITFHVFENFILIKGQDSNLMLSFEQDFSNN